MRQKGPILFIFLAVILAAAGAWSAQKWIKTKALKEASRMHATTPVVVSSGHIRAGQKIEANDLKILAWPRGQEPKGFYRKKKPLLGRVALRAITPDEVMMNSKLAPKGIAGGLSAVVPSGYRAMTVRVDEVIGVAGFVQPGDRVDVLATLQRGPFQKNPATKTVLQDVEVLAVGSRTETRGRGKQVKAKKVKVVTLKVHPIQGERLALASTTGKLILSLRNQGDRMPAPSPGISLAALSPGFFSKSQTKSKVKVKDVKKPAPKVEVIKGTKRSVEAL